MAATTRFVEVSDFTNYTDISSYIQTAYVERHILAAQHARVKPILGETLYEELQTQVEGSTLTSANQDLIDEIKPWLIYLSTAQYLPNANLFSTPMGIRVYKEENSEPASDKQIADITKYALQMAEIYENELRKFLCDNEDDYPDYKKENQPAKIVMPRIGVITKNEKEVDTRFYD